MLPAKKARSLTAPGLFTPVARLAVPTGPAPAPAVPPPSGGGGSGGRRRRRPALRQPGARVVVAGHGAAIGARVMDDEQVAHRGAGQERGSTTPPSPWVNTSPDSHSGPATTASRAGSAWPSRRSTCMPCQLPYMEGRINSLKPVSTSTKWLLPAFLVARTWPSSTPDSATRKRPGSISSPRAWPMMASACSRAASHRPW